MCKFHCFFQCCGPGFNADPDPALYLNADPDTNPDPRNQINADPDQDPGHNFKSQKVEFLHEKYTLSR